MMQKKINDHNDINNNEKNLKDKKGTEDKISLQELHYFNSKRTNKETKELHSTKKNQKEKSKFKITIIEENNNDVYAITKPNPNADCTKNQKSNECYNDNNGQHCNCDDYDNGYKEKKLILKENKELHLFFDEHEHIFKKQE